MKYLADLPLQKVDGIGNFDPGANGNSYSIGGALMNIEKLISTLVGFLTVVAGLSFMIYFMIGAMNWITAGGDHKKVEDAKSYMTNGAVGMIIIVVAYAIVWIVGKVLGIDILSPAQTIVDKIKFK